MMYFPCVIFNSGVFKYFFLLFVCGVYVMYVCVCGVCVCLCVCVFVCVCVCVLVRVSDIRISPCTVQGLSVFVLCLLQRQLKPEVRRPCWWGYISFCFLFAAGASA